MSLSVYTCHVRPQALIEIAPDADGQAPGRLLMRAYAASQTGLIVLSLTAITSAAVDEVLDQIVPHFPLNIAGVRYISTFDHGALAWALRDCASVFGDSGPFLAAIFEAAADACPRPTADFERGRTRMLPSRWHQSRQVGMGLRL